MGKNIVQILQNAFLAIQNFKKSMILDDTDIDVYVVVDFEGQKCRSEDPSGDFVDGNVETRARWSKRRRWFRASRRHCLGVTTNYLRLWIYLDNKKYWVNLLQFTSIFLGKAGAFITFFYLVYLRLSWVVYIKTSRKIRFCVRLSKCHSVNS